MNPSASSLNCVIFAIVGFVHLAKSFILEDCNLGSNSIASITRFEVLPDPISLRENITASVDLILHQDVPPGALIRTRISRILKRKREIIAPCVKGMGSCIVDHCVYLNRFRDQICPFVPPGVECGCPIKAGYYGGESVTVPVPQLGSFVEYFAYGDIRVVIQLIVMEQFRENVLACFSMTGTVVP